MAFPTGDQAGGTQANVQPPVGSDAISQGDRVAVKSEGGPGGGRKRFKWEPPALMALVLLLGVWLVWNQKNLVTGIKRQDGSRYVEFRLGNSRGEVEITPLPGVTFVHTPDGGLRSDTDRYMRFRVLLRNGAVSEEFDGVEFRKRYGDEAYVDVVRQSDNPVFRLFTITSWGNLAWVVLGLAGQLAFSGRMIVQWIVSEKERRSVVPEMFWWLSLGGGVALFVYFVWRQDFVGVLGQSSGLVVYARNIRLIHKRRRRQALGEGTDAAGRH